MIFARLVAVALSLAAAPLALARQAQEKTGPGVPGFQVRDGYQVTLAAENFGREARFIEFDDKGTLYVSQPSVGSIVALRDRDGDGRYEAKTDYVTGQPRVHGLHWFDGQLWFTTSGDVFRSRDADGDGRAEEVFKVIDDLPEGGGHWYRSICVTPTGLFTSIGDSRNIDDETASDRQKVWRYDLDGRGKELWCGGLRNTEKLRLRPGTDELWGADHGSDWFGRDYGEGRGNQPITDLYPPEEFNHYVRGGFYGHPFIVGDRVPRLEWVDKLGKEKVVEWAAKTIPPAYKGGAHWANNGFCFLAKDHFPDHRGDAFIAYHGSWNATGNQGYQVHRVLFDKTTGRPYGGLTVVSTLSADGNRVLGRPVDCVEAPDGSVLFSCDQTRKIYRISKAK